MPRRIKVPTIVSLPLISPEKLTSGNCIAKLRVGPESLIASTFPPRMPASGLSKVAVSALAGSAMCRTKRPGFPDRLTDPLQSPAIVAAWSVSEKKKPSARWRAVS